MMLETLSVLALDSYQFSSLKYDTLDSCGRMLKLIPMLNIMINIKMQVTYFRGIYFLNTDFKGIKLFNN